MYVNNGNMRPLIPVSPGGGAGAGKAGELGGGRSGLEEPKTGGGDCSSL
jgi:hypothetical protein